MRRRQIITIISVELLLLAVISLLLLPKTSLNTKIDAVNMTLTNYKFDYYVGTNVVKTGDVGTAKYTFEGIPAFYDLIIAYVDEDDGNCTYSVNLDGTEIASWTADKNPKKDCLFTKKVENIKLSDKAEIEIQGTRNKGESARLAHIEIIYSHGMNPLFLVKYGYEHFAQNFYTANVFLIIVALLAFLILNITAFTLLKPRKHLQLPKEPLENLTENVQNDAETSSSIPDVVPDSTQQNMVLDNKQNIDINTNETQREMPLIEQMVKYLETNYSDSNFSVQQMADHFNLSLNYLSSFFKEQTGQNIVYYMTNLRIEKAKTLLSSSEMQIKNIAENTGYYNVSSFIRRFKQVTGLTPGEYRLNKNVE